MTRSRRIAWMLLAASVAGNAIQRAHLVRARGRAEADSQTGLPGRRAWDRRSARLMSDLYASAECGGVLMIDIDHLKAINDRLGHGAGDEAIALVGKAIAQSVRRDDLAARVGGDEFVVMIPSGTLSDCATIGARIRKSLAGLCLDSAVGTVQVSIGVAAYPDDGVEIADVLAVADRRLYEAKRAPAERLPA